MRNEKIEEALTWIQNCIEGHRRNKKEIEYLTILLGMIEYQTKEIEVLEEKVTKMLAKSV